ncbi:MAG: BsuPI-related putative proteinase inhibitor [Bacillota bacterium]|nr:BsuPI-related putative proteinase inhibitor [Bacillota bacterium]MDW7684649.1 BsuPI-related putative proteinase inhibitor [Bacillota bacterium]
MKRVIIALLLGFLLVASFFATAGAANRLTLIVDGEVSDVVLTLRDGRAYLLLRDFAAVIKADVGWNPDTREASLCKEQTALFFRPGEKQVRQGTVIRETDAEPVLIDNRMHIPLRFAAEELGYGVFYNGADRSVSLGILPTDTALTTDLFWTVSEDNTVVFSLTVQNQTGETVTITLPSGQDFDFVAGRDGVVEHRWSEGQFFTKAIRNITFEPDEEKVFTWEWQPSASGIYQIEAYYLGISNVDPVYKDTLTISVTP